VAFCNRDNGCWLSLAGVRRSVASFAMQQAASLLADENLLQSRLSARQSSRKEAWLASRQAGNVEARLWRQVFRILSLIKLERKELGRNHLAPCWRRRIC